MALPGGGPASQWPGDILALAFRVELVLLPGPALAAALLAVGATGFLAACCCLCGGSAGRRRAAGAPPEAGRSPIKDVPGFPVPLLRKSHGA